MSCVAVVAPSPRAPDVQESMPFFDAAVASHEAFGLKRFAEFGVTGVLAAVAFERSLAIPDAEPTQTIAALFCILTYGLLRAPRRRAERIVVANGVIRISYFLEDRLVEQRRIKLCGLTILLRETFDQSCLQIALRNADRAPTRGRTINIARCLSPSERALFRDEFLEGLRRSGSNPEICRTYDANSMPRSVWAILRTKVASARDDASVSSRMRAVATRARSLRLGSWRNLARAAVGRRLKWGGARESLSLRREP